MRRSRLIAVVLVAWMSCNGIRLSAQDSPKSGSPLVISPGKSQELQKRTETPTEPKLPATVKGILENGDRLLRAGQRDQATLEFIKARQEAGKILDNDRAFDRRKIQSQIDLRRGSVLLHKADQAKSPADYRAAIEVFHQVSENGSPYQKSLANLNKAAAYLKIDEPQQTINILTDKNQLDWANIAKSDHYVLNFNLAEAYAKTGQGDVAVDHYLKSVKENPQFSRGAQEVVKNAGPVIAKQPVKLFEYAGQLNKYGRSREAIQLGIGAMQGKFGEQKLDKFGLSVILEAWACDFPGPQEFMVRESLVLKQLQNEVVGEAGVNDLLTIASGQLALIPSAIESGRHPDLDQLSRLVANEPKNSSPVRAAASRFVAAVANWWENKYAFAEEHQEKADCVKHAAARYLLAWGMDHGNAVAARGLAWSLSQKETDVAIGGSMFERVFDAVFEGKVRAYDDLIQKPELAKNPQIWETLLKMHILLAQMLQARNELGDSHDARSAIFQWEHAASSEGMVRKTDLQRPTFSVPHIYQNLAVCYQRVNRNKDAADARINATERFLLVLDVESANKQLELITSLDLTEGQKTRIANLKVRLQEARQKQEIEDKANNPK